MSTARLPPLWSARAMDPPSLTWGTPPPADTAAIRSGADLAAHVLTTLGGVPDDRRWVLLIEASADSPTRLSDPWTVDWDDEIPIQVEGLGYAVELAEREAWLRQHTRAADGLAPRIAASDVPITLVLVERDGPSISICDCKMRLSSS